MLKRSKKLHFVSLVTTVVIILVVLILGFLQVNSVINEKDQVTRTQTIIRNLTDLVTEFETLEALIYESDEEPYPQVLDKYLDIDRQIQFQFSQLISSKPGTLLEESYFDTLQAKSNSYLDKFQNILTTKYQPRPESEWASQFPSMAEVGIISFISKWSRQEADALAVQLQEARKLRSKLLWTSILFLIGLVLFQMISHRRVMKEFDRCDEAILENRINNDVFEYIEKMASMGHAYYNFKQKKLVFSPNLLRVLGYSPTEADPTFKMYLDRIYPTDLKHVLEKLKSLTLVKNSVETSARIVTPQGGIRNMRLLGLIRNDEQGRIAVFVTKDVTSEITSQEMLKELNTNLSLQNRLFHHVESIASIGYYSQIEDSGEEFFSDNLFRLLGFTPESFLPSKKILLSHVLEEDRAKASAWMDPKSEYSSVPEMTIRILNRYDKVLYFSLSREFFKEDNAQIFLITFKDVSAKAAVNRDLEQKNMELFRSNAELESFNHIASHDLQEPIRKIQTLISMLKTLPDLSMPAKAEDYLSRIRRSANRMQLLILDLLKFSSVSKVAKKFEIFSLQTVIENVLEELSLKISEKDAEVKVSDLPEAPIVPSQMQQLFTNLIENALKFADHTRKPRIKIFTEDLSEQEKSLFPTLEQSELLKVSIQDNGIGFDPVHSETIFVIFNRLHDKQSFEGSGIGLAICKKVVENHGGIIFAKGIPGDGSKFTFIIPTSTHSTFQKV